MAGIKQSPPLVVCDAGPLIHLDELACLDLLEDFQEVLVSPEVWREVERHRPLALRQPGTGLRQVSPAGAPPPALETMAQVLTLHAGEREALQVALEHAGAILLTDDTAARLAAGNLGLETHGTIGVLVRAIRRLQRTRGQVLAILRLIPEQSSLHLKRSLLEAVIAEVERGG